MKDEDEKFAYVPFPSVLYKRLGKLSIEEKAQMLDMMYQYYIDDIAPNEDDFVSVTVELTFEFLKPFIDKHKDIYIKRCEAGKKGGKLGGAPKNNQNASKNKAKLKQRQSKDKAKSKQNQSETTQDKDKDNDKDKLSLSLDNDNNVSIVGMPEGQPTQKPEYSELRQYFKSIAGYDDAYMCDDFERAIKKYGNDWTDWQNKFYRFAVKQGIIRDGTTV